MEKFNANGANFKPGTIRLWDNGDYKITEEDKQIIGTKDRSLLPVWLIHSVTEILISLYSYMEVRAEC